MNQPITTPKTGASLNRHGSNPNRGTPPAFIDAIEARFGEIDWDLAATKDNSVCGAAYFGPDHKRPDYRDALKCDWSSIDGNHWLNPPFSSIPKWAKKCEEHRDRKGWTLLLVPDSRDSNWYIEHVAGKCIEIPLSGRIVFVGEETGFPKALALFAYGYGLSGVMPAWRWDTSKRWAVERRRRLAHG